MKKICIVIILSSLAMFSCKREKPAQEEPASVEEVQTDTVAVPDTTLYGTSAEFGMSTFSLATDGGDTLYVTRTASDGTDGIVIGSLDEGCRYAMTTRDDGEAIGVLINLTQLERFTKDYEILNGALILKTDGEADTIVRVATLTDTEFEATGVSGKQYSLRASK